MKKNSLLALAILLLVLGGLVLYMGQHNNAIRPLGIILIMASLYLANKSKAQNTSVSVDTSDPRIRAKPTNRPGPLMWIVSAAMVPLVEVSYLLLRNDAAQGAKEVWPVYLFAGVAVVCGLFWAALVGRLMS
jgi:hypothetical protein